MHQVQGTYISIIYTCNINTYIYKHAVWSRSHVMTPCHPAQLHIALQHPPATLPTAGRKATSPLSEVTGERNRQKPTGSMQAW